MNPTESTITKTALITGSGRQRLGAGLARHLATQGFRIALHYHQSKAAAEATVTELNEAGTEAIALSADVTDQDQVKQMFAELVEQFGQLEI